MQNDGKVGVGKMSALGELHLPSNADDCPMWCAAEEAISPEVAVEPRLWQLRKTRTLEECVRKRLKRHL